MVRFSEITFLLYTYNIFLTFFSYGIDIRTGGVCDTLSIGIIEGKQAKSKAVPFKLYL